METEDANQFLKIKIRGSFCLILKKNDRHNARAMPPEKNRKEKNKKQREK
ncbi:hypothetical protein [Methanolapillus africanus]